MPGGVTGVGEMLMLQIDRCISQCEYVIQWATSVYSTRLNLRISDFVVDMILGRQEIPNKVRFSDAYLCRIEY